MDSPEDKYGNDIQDLIQNKAKRFFEEKNEIVEGILEQLLQCRTWTEITTMTRKTFGHDNEYNPQENWYFKDKKILTVTLRPTETGIQFIYDGYTGGAHETL